MGGVKTIPGDDTSPLFKDECPVEPLDSTTMELQETHLRPLHEMKHEFFHKKKR